MHQWAAIHKHVVVYELSYEKNQLDHQLVLVARHLSSIIKQSNTNSRNVQQIYKCIQIHILYICVFVLALLPWGASGEGSTSPPQHWIALYPYIHHQHYYYHYHHGIGRARKCSGSPSETPSAASREKPMKIKKKVQIISIIHVCMYGEIFLTIFLIRQQNDECMVRSLLKYIQFYCSIQIGQCM